MAGRAGRHVRYGQFPRHCLVDVATTTTTLTVTMATTTTVPMHDRGIGMARSVSTAWRCTLEAVTQVGNANGFEGMECLPHHTTIQGEWVRHPTNYLSITINKVKLGLELF